MRFPVTFPNIPRHGFPKTKLDFWKSMLGYRIFLASIVGNLASLVYICGC